MTRAIRAPSSAAIADAVALLRQGAVVGLPTETVYGLAGLASDGAAVARIFATKGRPSFDPLIAHVAAPPGWPHVSIVDWLRHLRLVPPLGAPDGLTADSAATVERLAKAFWPGPLTLVLPRGEGVHELATSGLPSVAVRMPDHPVAQALLTALGQPLVAPSANRFGRISPTSAADVAAELGEQVGLILDGGTCRIGVESTVALVGSDGSLLLLRPGAVSAEQLAFAAGAVVSSTAATIVSATSTSPASILASASTTTSASASPAAALSPGMLLSHYAPSKPLRLLPASLERLVTLDDDARSRWRSRWLTADEHALSPSDASEGSRVGLLIQRGARSVVERWARVLFGSEVQLEILSESGDLEEAARNLFRALRSLDDSPAELLFAEAVDMAAPAVPQAGLAAAIVDRLRRASRGTAELVASSGKFGA